jgi:hypothetical protein
MFEKGVDCKSYSIYYATLANMMGYKYVFFNTDNHVMTIVHFDSGYCILDQDFGTCINYKGENKEIVKENFSLNSE